MGIACWVILGTIIEIIVFRLPPSLFAKFTLLCTIYLSGAYEHVVDKLGSLDKNW
jgi:hypothetical protein